MSELFSTVSRFFHAELFTIAGTPINVATLATAFVIVGMTVWISRWVQHAIEHTLRRRGVQDEGSIGVTRRLAHYLIAIGGLAVALHTLGINLTALFAAGAFVAVALGFAMQNITQNFVSGVILLVERTIKPGDVLEVEGKMVRVNDMGIRSTVARTLDEEDLIIPNATLVQSTVKNYTLRDNLCRVRTEVGVVYGADMAQVMEVLQEAVRKVPNRLSTKEPVVYLVRFGSSSVDFEVSVWIDNPWRVRATLSQLNDAIWWSLKEAGITIAFPQLDLHLDPPVMESLAARGSRPPGSPPVGRETAR